MRTIGFLILTLFSANAQNKADIQSIRNIYYKIKEDVSFSVKYKSEGRLYCNKIERNVNDMSWRAMGSYHKTTNLWYSYNFSDEHKNFYPKLEYVTVSEIESKLHYSVEYLFENEKLIFCYTKSEIGEFRFYFKNEKLIKEIKKTNENVDENEYMVIPTSDIVLAEGKLLQKKFQYLFN